MVRELPDDPSQRACELFLSHPSQPRGVVNAGLGLAVGSGGLAQPLEAAGPQAGSASHLQGLCGRVRTLATDPEIKVAAKTFTEALK